MPTLPVREENHRIKNGGMESFHLPREMSQGVAQEEGVAQDPQVDIDPDHLCQDMMNCIEEMILWEGM